MTTSPDKNPAETADSSKDTKSATSSGPAPTANTTANTTADTTADTTPERDSAAASDTGPTRPDGSSLVAAADDTEPVLVAKEALFIGRARAHNPGDVVPAANVERHGWDDLVETAPTS